MAILAGGARALVGLAFRGRVRGRVGYSRSDFLGGGDRTGLISARIPWKALAAIQRTRRRIRAQPDQAHGNGDGAWDTVLR